MDVSTRTMRNEETYEEQLRGSWNENAVAWTDAVRTGQIPSRRSGTDTAILNAIYRFARCRVLDLGCGEGWLARALDVRGYQVVGVDASASLVQEATRAGGGRFVCMSYDDLITRPGEIGETFQLAVANFSLLGENIRDLLGGLRKSMTHDALIIIQTMHPLNIASDTAYQSGWRIETFSQFGLSFKTHMPFFFRTFSLWMEDLSVAGLHVVRVEEPLHPETLRPLSLLIVASW